MTRFNAFLVHLSLSLLVVGGFVLTAYFVWYPQPLLSLQGGITIVGILMAVDVIIGPSLTFLVFKPAKRGLKFDLSAIVLVQITAFLYGAFIIYSERPTYLTFAYNQFYVVVGRDLESEPPREMAVPEQYGIDGPKVVFSVIPENKIKSGEAMFASLVGAQSLALDGQTYRMFPHDMAVLARESFKPADVLSDIGEEVRPWAASRGLDPEALYYFHVVGRKNRGVAVVDPKAGKLVGIFNRDLLEAGAKAKK